LNANAQSSKDSVKRVRIQPLPSVFHTPETSWGFGATVLGFINPKDTSTRKSNAQLFLDFTLNRQASFQSDFNIFTKKNTWYIKGSHDLSKFPEFYFGIGNENPKDGHCLIDITYFDGKVTFFKKLTGQLYAGPTFHHQQLQHINKPIIQDGFAIDNMGYMSTGFGVSALIDNRNNLLCPSEGYYLETKIQRYFDQSHSTSGFTNQQIDLRYYHTFKHDIVLNTNLYSVHNQGIVPFRMMPFIGGPRFLRGYYAGRFRDNNLSLIQGEVRKTVFWRVGVAAFSGVAQVYSMPSEFQVNKFHYNYGAGLRFQLHKDSPANIRVDYGRTADSHGFYVVFGECF
jgi:outer membrane protein assembly factor BamA